MDADRCSALDSSVHSPAVYTSVSEMHLKDMGLQTQWYNVDVPDGGEVRWEGVVRRYWDLPTYRLPICTFDM